MMKSYTAHVTMRPGATRRFLHDMIDGQRAGIMEATPGERGWLWYYNGEETEFGYPYHRLHTSPIESVAMDGGDIVITTMNTIYRLSPN